MDTRLPFQQGTICHREWNLFIMGTCKIWSAAGFGLRTDSFPHLHINDIAEGLNSTIRLFADDSVLYREIKGQDDHHTLQKDLLKFSTGRTNGKCCSMPLNASTWQSPAKNHHLYLTIVSLARWLNKLIVINTLSLALQYLVTWHLSIT